MKKQLAVSILFSLFVLSTSAQTSVDNEVTIFYSYGLASKDQFLSDRLSEEDDPYDGLYADRKNGFYVDGAIKMEASFENRYDFFMEVAAKSRLGAPYLNLQLSPTKEVDSGLSLDSLYARLHLSEILISDMEILGADTKVNLKAGQYEISATDADVSRFGLESSMNMLKMKNSPAITLETIVSMPGAAQFYRGRRSNIRLDLASSGRADEGIQRLYDTDGGLSNHGKVVTGEYAPQFFSQLCLNDYVLPFGSISAGLGYAFNASGIYSGHSAGAFTRVTTEVLPGKLHIPAALSAAYYQKNIDTLAGAAGNSLVTDTTDFRDSVRLGFVLGAQYIANSFGIAGDPKVNGDITLSGSCTNIQHIYRDPVSFFELGIDGQYLVTPEFFIGGGFLLGTLTDVTWQTKEGVSASFDDFRRTYSPADNFGYEVYMGVDVTSVARISLGFANFRGLSMNYGLESIQSGMVKYRQAGTDLIDGLWETRGIYLLATIEL